MRPFKSGHMERAFNEAVSFRFGSIAVAAIVLLLTTQASAQIACPSGDDECFSELFESWKELDSPGWQSDPIVQASPPWGNEEPEFSWVSQYGHYWIYARDIQRDGSSVTAWIREKKLQPEPNGTVRTLTRMTFDCKGRYRYTAQTVYGENDRVIQEIDREDAWAYVRPDSAYDQYQNALCRKP